MKHRLLTFSVVVALFFALAIPAFAASKTLGVSEIDQKKRNGVGQLVRK